jgi:cellulose synthase (UDP-forming)
MSIVAAPGTPGRHRSTGLVLPQAPSDRERESYSWRALPYLTIALFLSSLCVVLAQVLMESRNAAVLPVAVALFSAYTLVYVLYQVLSLPVNFTGKSFDLATHDTFVASWRPQHYPDVDIYLPICREPIAVLRNTWTGVFELVHAYPGTARAYVLDDGDSDEAQALSGTFGFFYIRRPVHEHKKSGNLNYAFARTNGEHIVIFDADFRPRSDFLAETLPYLDDPATGLVQTPQYFRVSRQQTWIERAAGVTLEVFYRAVQVSRDRFGSALCVGSNCVYRRAALRANGGFTLIPYAEDSHTGLDARRAGFSLKYLPVPLAAGICPSSLDSFMRQQYRWCCGATSLVWSRHMWSVQMPWRSRLPYVAGWMWNLTTALRTLVLPLIPITLLAFLPGEIQLRNALLLIPAVLSGLVLYPLWHNAPFTPRTWPLAIAVGWAQVLAIWDYARGRVMSWQPSRSPADATRRFWWGVTGWNGTLALTWVGLAFWRLGQSGSGRFAIVAGFGVINMLIISRLIFPGKKAA